LSELEVLIMAAYSTGNLRRLLCDTTKTSLIRSSGRLQGRSLQPSHCAMSRIMFVSAFFCSYANRSRRYCTERYCAVLFAFANWL